ncbi:MAG: hypothetical protein IMZ66_08315, partial [Planctomycetes bacterium]|nr:hypothetical protein [Planctomycetota bacterium]
MKPLRLAVLGLVLVVAGSAANAASVAQSPPAVPSPAAGAPEQFGLWGARAKAHAYLADAGLESAAPAPADASAGDKARGFITFTRPPSFAIKPDFVPTAEDRAAPLAAADCPGQYGAIVLGVLALQPGEFSVTVTDLAGPGGAKIAAANFDVRAVRYIKAAGKQGPEVTPVLLEKRDRVAVAAGRVQPFWITFHVPPGTAAGVYEGRARVLVGEAEKAALPVRLEVYPFILAEPDANLYLYYNNSTEAATLPLAARQLADQRCHGMNMAPLLLPVTSDGEMRREAIAPWLDLYKRIGFPRTHLHVGLWNRITAEWLNTPDKAAGMYCPWFRYYPFSEKLDRRYAETVRMLRDETRRRGLELVLTVSDEPGSHPWTTEATQHYNDLVKTEAPDVLRELTVGGGWAMKRPEDELWKGRIHIWTTNRWLTDKLDLVRQGDPKAVIQIYNMAGDGSVPGGITSARALFGFFLWKSKAAGAAQWTYYHNATAPNNYTWPAEDAAEGHVPTLRWEMVREGTKDLRYVTT